MRDSFVFSLENCAEYNRNLILITADLGFGIFDSFVNRFGNQFINVGVAEQAMIGVASGLALQRHPVVAYSIGNFATMRCLEQIRNDACYHNVNVTIVASGGGFTYGQLGMSHHATEDLSIMRSLPGMDVCAPATKYESVAITEILINRDNVSYMRLEKDAVAYDDFVNKFNFGKMTQITDGPDATVISIGSILSESIIAADLLAKQGINITVLSCHSLKPFDRLAVEEAARKTKNIITVEEHSIIGGLGSAVAEAILESRQSVNYFHRIGMKDVYSSIVGDQKYLRNYYDINHGAIVEHVYKALAN